MRKPIVPFIAVLLLAITACEKVIEPKNLPQQDPMLVMNCILYPDSNIKVNLSVSKSILSGKDYKYVSNAVCDLYEDGVYISSLSSGSSTGDYVFATKAKANTSYTIKAAASGFKSVSATSAMPGDMNITAVEHYDTTNSRFEIMSYNDGQHYIRVLSGQGKFRFSIIDDITVKNYYSIHPIVIVYDSTGASEQVQNVSISPNTQGINIVSNGLTLDLDDQTLVNGKEVQADFSINFSFSQDEIIPNHFEIYLEIYSLSEDLYKYQKTVTEQASTRGGFFSEPVLVYNNIQNGMGILGGAYIKTVKILP